MTKTKTTTSEVKSVADLDLRISIDPAVGSKSVEAAARAIAQLPLQLPASGRYLAQLEGTVLHIWNTAAGITRYHWSDTASAPEFSVDASGVSLALKDHPAIGTIMLHAQKATDDPKAVPLRVVPALPLVEEYNQLKAKQYPAGSEAEKARDQRRQVELVRDIQKIMHPDPAQDQDPDALAAAPQPPAPTREERRAARVRKKIKKAESDPAASKPTRE